MSAARANGRAAARNRDRRFPAGSYHTDGERLLRMVSEEDHGELRAVEDCRSLELLLISMDELDSLGLRPVATAGDAAHAGQPVVHGAPERS